MTRACPSRRRRALLATTVAFAAGLFIAVFLSGCEREQKPVVKKPRPVRYAKITTGGASGLKSFSASVQAGDTTQLSFRVGGTLAKVAYKRGDKVARGKLIGALDDTDYKVQVAQARAQRQSARTRRDAARTTLNRIEKLYESNSASLSDFQNAKTQLRAAEAELSAAGQQVTAARNQLGYTKLTAPFTGVLQQVAGHAGEAVGPGQVIAVLSKGDQLEVKASLPEAFIARIKVGTPVVVTITALADRQFKGTASEVAFASEGAAAYPVIVALDETDEAIRPGMAATVTFDLESGPEILRVPVSAVGNEESGNFVLLLEPRAQTAPGATVPDDPNSPGAAAQTYVVRKQTVTLGSLSGEFYPVEDGLAEGSLVATAGLSLLLDGMVVRLLETGEK